MESTVILMSTLVLMLAYQSEANSFRSSKPIQNFKGVGRQFARRFQSIVAPKENFNSISAPFRREYGQSPPNGRHFSWFSARYPYSPIDAFLPEEEYEIIDFETLTSIEPFRPKWYNTISYPFNVSKGWKVVDPIELGVSPPVLPEDYKDINYSGYYYACPPDVFLNDPEVWDRGSKKLFTLRCEYFYYF